MGELASAAWTAGITIAALFVAVTAVGFWLLFRRGRGARRPSVAAQRLGPGVTAPSTQRANIQLVRADDAVRDAQDELDFAIAQFGPAKTGNFARALGDARQRVLEAFTLQQRLDDHVPDTGTQRREWTARIVHLCETAQAGLAAELRHFESLREREKNAPEQRATVGQLAVELHARTVATAETMQRLGERFSPAALSSVSDNLDRAAENLTAATACLAETDAALLEDSLDSRAIDGLRAAEEQLQRASHFYDAIDTLAAGLDRAADAVTTLLEATRDNLAEAKAERDSAADAAAGASIIAAISRLEQTVAQLDASDPVAALDALREANAGLDASLAGARNQKRRLEGAREALSGALVSAHSQLSATRDYISTRRGGVGSTARTRLAEAERLLTVAEAEADPVLALDTARSSASYARDADALARYDVLR